MHLSVRTRGLAVPQLSLIRAVQSAALQPRSCSAFDFFLCCSEAKAWRDPLELRAQSLVRERLLGTAPARPVTGDTALTPPRTLQKEQRLLPGARELGRKGLFPS